MKRTFAAVVVWLGIVLAVSAIPARLPYVPLPPKAPATPALAGTVWRGQLFDPNTRIAFLGDGTLTYGEPGNTSPGSWRLEGNRLYFEIAKYSEYDTILQGDVIQGDGWNKAGQRCKPLLQRVYNEQPTSAPPRR